MNANLFSKDKIRRRELGILVDDVDGGLVNESHLTVGRYHFPLLLVEADVGVEANTKQRHNLVI